MENPITFFLKTYTLKRQFIWTGPDRFGLMTYDLLCPLFAQTPISGCWDTSFILFVQMFPHSYHRTLTVTNPWSEEAVCPLHNIKGPVITLFNWPLVK